MATEIRTENAGLTESPIGQQLVEDPCSFEFFQAVTLLQRLRADLRPVGDFSSPSDEVVRFKANPRLAFPASEIQKLEVQGNAQPEMMVNFMGLTGPMGVLPYTYSELILERARAKDYGLAAFLDIFNHRAISLFYRAWQKSRFPVTYSLGGKRDLFTQYLLDLVGLGTTGLRDRLEVEDEALLHYVSLVAMQSRSAEALEEILADYFEVPVEIQQFTGGAGTRSIEPLNVAMTDEETTLASGRRRRCRWRLRLGPAGARTHSDRPPGNGTLLRFSPGGYRLEISRCHHPFF